MLYCVNWKVATNIRNLGRWLSGDDIRRSDILYQVRRDDLKQNNIMALLTYLLTYLITYLLTYLLTRLLAPWNRNRFPKLTVSQLVKKFPTFY